MQFDPSVLKAWHRAKQARLRAHVPYSKFRVGAALQIENFDPAITGCNVENASYGATICAERSAVVRAVSRFGAIHPRFLLVVTDEQAATVPCALCLQVLAEFCEDAMPIYLGNLEGVQRMVRLRDLLPQPFRSFSVAEKT